MRRLDHAALGLLAIVAVPVLVVGGLIDLAHRVISVGTKRLSRRFPRLPLRKDL